MKKGDPVGSPWALAGAAQRARGFVINQYVTTVQRFELIDEADHGGFAGTRGAEDGHHFAGCDGEIYPVEHLMVAVAFDHISELNAGMFQM